MKEKSIARRDFIKRAGMGSLGTMAVAGLLPEPATAAVNTCRK